MALSTSSIYDAFLGGVGTGYLHSARMLARPFSPAAFGPLGALWALDVWQAPPDIHAFGPRPGRRGLAPISRVKPPLGATIFWFMMHGLPPSTAVRFIQAIIQDDARYAALEALFEWRVRGCGESVSSLQLEQFYQSMVGAMFPPVRRRAYWGASTLDGRSERSVHSALWNAAQGDLGRHREPRAALVCARGASKAFRAACRRAVPKAFQVAFWDPSGEQPAPDGRFHVAVAHDYFRSQTCGASLLHAVQQLQARTAEDGQLIFAFPSRGPVKIPVPEFASRLWFGWSPNPFLLSRTARGPALYAVRPGCRDEWGMEMSR